MTLNEIKSAVSSGKTVHWCSSAYTVEKDQNGKWLITYKGSTVTYIGLTWNDGITLNGQPGDFYVAS